MSKLTLAFPLELVRGPGESISDTISQLSESTVPLHHPRGYDMLARTE